METRSPRRWLADAADLPNPSGSSDHSQGRAEPHTVVTPGPNDTTSLGVVRIPGHSPPPGYSPYGGEG